MTDGIETQRSAAYDVLQYISIWVEKHDPDFQEQIAGKNLAEIIGLANSRYGSRMDDKHPTVSDLLYHFPVYIQRYKESNKIVKRRELHRKMAMGDEVHQKPIGATKDSDGIE